MWKDSIRNIVVIFQPNILRIVGFYVRHWAIVFQCRIFNLIRFHLLTGYISKSVVYNLGKPCKKLHKGFDSKDTNFKWRAKKQNNNKK